jgi:aspartyl/asparaginyl beta-hydroxylase (cupin superfamily)
MTDKLSERINARRRSFPDDLGRFLNARFYRQAGGSDRPAFFDIDTTYPALRILDRNYTTIREELDAILPFQERIPRYHDVSRRETYISGTVDPQKNWRVFMLRSLLGSLAVNEAKCPRTVGLLRQIPNVVQALFSILDPGKSIPAHDGPYLGYIRYHLGLRVPRHNPPVLRVKDTHVTWEEGKSFLFDDSWNHEVFNKSDDVRVVLIVDVLRPMPLPWHATNWLATRFLGRHTEEAKQVLANIRRYS